MHASSQGTHAAAGAPRGGRASAQQGLRVHASLQGTHAAAGAAHSIVQCPAGAPCLMLDTPLCTMTT